MTATCNSCKREITDKVSLLTGYGPECRGQFKKNIKIYFRNYAYDSHPDWEIKPIRDDADIQIIIATMAGELIDPGRNTVKVFMKSAIPPYDYTTVRDTSIERLIEASAWKFNPHFHNIEVIYDDGYGPDFPTFGEIWGGLIQGYGMDTEGTMLDFWQFTNDLDGLIIHEVECHFGRYFGDCGGDGFIGEYCSELTSYGRAHTFPMQLQEIFFDGKYWPIEDFLGYTGEITLKWAGENWEEAPKEAKDAIRNGALVIAEQAATRTSWPEDNHQLQWTESLDSDTKDVKMWFTDQILEKLRLEIIAAIGNRLHEIET